MEIHYLPGEKAHPQIKIDAEVLLDLLLRHLEAFLSSINSYLGLLKHRTNYGVIRDMAELVSPKWLKYCHYNDDRRCFEANDGYGHHDILANTYKFRYHDRYHDRKRTKRAA